MHKALRRVYLLLTQTADCPNQMLAVMVLSHRVSSSKTFRLLVLCGAQYMEHAFRTWSAVCSEAPQLQFGEGARTPFVHVQMELPNTCWQAIELNLSWSGQAQSNWPGTGHGYKSTKPGCTLTVFRLPSITRPLRSADA